MGNKENVLSTLYCKVDDNMNIDTKSVTTCSSNKSYSFVPASGSAANVTNGYLKPLTTTNNPITNADYVVPEKLTCYRWWTEHYYPYVIKEGYPVYIQERAKDNGKRAYEIIKTLKDKGLIEVDTVKRFMELMDELIKIL